jgi:hypothetical protein
MNKRLRQELLQSAVLIFQRLEPEGVRDFHPAIARPPLVERRVADRACGTPRWPTARQRVPSEP